MRRTHQDLPIKLIIIKVGSHRASDDSYRLSIIHAFRDDFSQKPPNNTCTRFLYVTDLGYIYQ